MNIHKMIVGIALVGFMGIGHVAFGMQPGHQGRQPHVGKFDNDPFVDALAGTVLNFYGNLAQAGIEAVKEQAATEREIRKTNAQAKAEALKVVAATKVIMDSLTNGKNLTKVSLAVVGGAAGISAAYFSGKLLFKYLNALLGKPILIRDTSIKSQKERFVDFILRKKPVPSRFDEILVDGSLEMKLKEIADTLEMSIADGDGVRHILLTGPAGTGKTMFAKALAIRLNQRRLMKDGKRIPVHYACCAGADFAQFKAGQDIDEIHKIIDFALKSEGITVLFIDEIDSLLKNRLDSLANEASINRTNTFLSIFDKPTHQKIMIVGATNFEHKIDKAAFSRFSKKIAFSLPTGQTLEKLFDQYLNKEVLHKGMSTDETFNQRKSELIESLNGLSPRTIEDIASQIYTRLRFLRSKTLTYEIAHGLIEEAKDAEKRNRGTNA